MTASETPSYMLDAEAAGGGRRGGGSGVEKPPTSALCNGV